MYEEAEQGEWDQAMVFAALAKEEVDGKAVVVPQRKKGKTFLNLHFLNPFLPMQLWKSAAVGLLEIFGATSWAGLSLSLEKSEMDLQCTDKLTQKKYGDMDIFCCTGEKSPPLPFSPGLMMNG